jgi:hypothetical protein
MRRLGLLVIGLCLATSALIGGAVLYGRANPESDTLQALGFDLRGGQLVFMGIVPGVTSSDDGELILYERGENARVFNALSATLTISLPAGSVDVQFWESLDKIDWLHLEMLGGHFLPAGTLVSIFGEPCAVQRRVYGGRYTAQLVYPSMHVLLQPSDKGISPWDGIVEVQLDHYQRCPPATTWVPWIGFASYERYETLGWDK